MTAAQAIKSVLTQYIGFDGRACRSEFWYWILALVFISIGIGSVETIIWERGTGAGPILRLFFIGNFLPTIAVAYRRFHDSGRSGWWIAVFFISILLAPLIILFIVIFAVNHTDVSPVITPMTRFIVLGVCVGLFLYAVYICLLLCDASQIGFNKYGPNPKGDGNFDIFS